MWLLFFNNVNFNIVTSNYNNMQLTRKLFYNKRNGQAMITLPSKILRDLQKDMKCDKQLDKLSFKIINKKLI